MFEALIAGQRSPKVLAELAWGRARTRRAGLERALYGRFTDHHARLAGLLQGQLDELSARIDQVTELRPASTPSGRLHPNEDGHRHRGRAHRGIGTVRGGSCRST